METIVRHLVILTNHAAVEPDTDSGTIKFIIDKMQPIAMCPTGQFQADIEILGERIDIESVTLFYVQIASCNQVAGDFYASGMF